MHSCNIASWKSSVTFFCQVFRYADKESKTPAPYFALSVPCCFCSTMYLPNKNLWELWLHLPFAPYCFWRHQSVSLIFQINWDLHINLFFLLNLYVTTGQNACSGRTYLHIKTPISCSLYVIASPNASDNAWQLHIKLRISSTLDVNRYLRLR